MNKLLKYSIAALLSIGTGIFSSMAQDLEQYSLKKGVKLSGGLSFNNTFYSGSDSLINRDPYLYTLCGNLNINAFGADLPFSFALTNSGVSYTQPFNKFQIAPKYKWAKLYIASANMNFSPYTLAGHDFTGVGMELTPGKWYVGAMYGRLLKAIEYDPLIDNINTVAYKRMGYGAKVGYKDKGTDADIIFFSAEDKESSLKFHVPEDIDLHPQKNTAASLRVRQAFLKKFFVQAEYAASVYNSDIRNAEGEKVKTSNLIDKLFQRKGNDRFVDAFNASAGYQGERWGLSFCYERVAPDYQTLGGYYFVNDLENYSFAPYIKFMKGKLGFSGKIGWEYNNLNDEKANDTKRLTGAVNANFADGKNWTVSAAFSNYSTYTKFRQTAYPYYTDDLDSLNFYQIQRSLNSNIGYMFGKNKEMLVNALNLSAAYQKGSAGSGDVKNTLSDIVSMSLSFGENFVKQKLTWALFTAVNYADASNMESIYYGPGVNLQKVGVNDKLTAGLSCAYNQNRLNGVNNSSLLNSALTASYRITGEGSKVGNHSVSASFNLTNRFRTSSVNKAYEFLSTVNYSVNF